MATVATASVKWPRQQYRADMTSMLSLSPIFDDRWLNPDMLKTVFADETFLQLSKKINDILPDSSLLPRLNIQLIITIDKKIEEQMQERFLSNSHK